MGHPPGDFQPDHFDRGSCQACLRSPQSTRVEATMMAMPTEINPIVTKSSCQG